MARWTTEMKQYLQDNYGRIPARDIAKKLNRPESSVYKYAKNMNLTTMRSRLAKHISKSVDEHLCWHCKYADNTPIGIHATQNCVKIIRCPWANKLQPVKGWKTKDIVCKREITNGGEYSIEKKFAVVKCPLYEVG